MQGWPTVFGAASTHDIHEKDVNGDGGFEDRAQQNARSTRHNHVDDVPVGTWRLGGTLSSTTTTSTAAAAAACAFRNS